MARSAIRLLCKAASFLALGLGLNAAPALADCKAELAEIDRRLEGAEIDSHMVQMLKTFRDQGAASCDAGNETSAGASFTAIEKILESQAIANTSTTQSVPVAAQPPAGAFTMSDAETVYINEAGEGILRYTVPGGTSGETYSFATGAYTGDAQQPIEQMSSGFGTYTGPDIAIFVWGLGQGGGIPIDRFVMTLYQREPFKEIAHFKFVVDPSKAEPKENCGEIDIRTDECSIKLR